MFRSFMRVPAQLLDDEAFYETTIPSGILKLPPHIMDLIFDELDVLDRCAFALTSRTILCLAQRNEHLDYIIQSPPGEHRIQHFFEIQLGHGWIPADLSYCPDCGRFVSTDQTHWRYVSEKYTREHSGNIARVWRERREDGWLRYWIERWCGGLDATAQDLIQADITRPLCPRCAILNPDTNAWRLKRLEARNERHTGSQRRLLSPGLYSPEQRRITINPSHLNQPFI